MKYDQDTKYFSQISKQKVKCSHCGHIIVFYTNAKKLICNHCGYLAYKNEKEKFKDIIKSKINKKGEDKE